MKTLHFGLILVSAFLIGCASTSPKVSSNNPMAPMMHDVIQTAIADMFTFPELTNNVPEGGDPQVQALLSWVQSDVTNYPGKSIQQISYSIVMGAGDKDVYADAGDLAEPYLIHYGDRSALATLIVRPHSAMSERAFVVVTYYGGGQLLDREITLQWFHKSQKWSLLRGSGPGSDKIRP